MVSKCPLRISRRRKGQSMREASINIGVSYASVSRYEAGKTLPKIDVLKAIYRLLQFYNDFGKKYKLR